jgi:hypothetical protein
MIEVGEVCPLSSFTRSYNLHDYVAISSMRWQLYLGEFGGKTEADSTLWAVKSCGLVDSSLYQRPWAFVVRGS